MTDAGVYAGAAAMGAVAGMRTLAAPAILTQLAREGGSAGRDEFGLLSHPITGYAAMALAAAEAAADKLPLMPRRAEAESLAARAVSGATTGAAICSAKKRPPLIGALLGALGALAAAYALSALHRPLDALEIPEPMLAIVEDALAVGAGLLVLSKLKAQSEPGRPLGT